MRRNIKILGLSFLAVFAFAAMSAASASASQPAAEGAPTEFTGSNSEGGTLETVGKRIVSCKSDTSKGEINSSTTIKGAKVIFKTCTAEGPFGKLICTSTGAAEGEIRSEALKGTLYYIGNGSEVGIDLEPESATSKVFASFTCTGFLVSETITVTGGSVVGKLTPLNTSTTSYTLEFTQSAGKQIPEGYLSPVGCEFVKDVLSTEGKGSETFGPEQSGIKTKETITTVKAIKVVASKCV